MPSNLTKRIIPCLDVNVGRVVKGINFAGLRDAGDPVELAQRYETQGADELVMLDISATQEARATSLRTVAAIRRVFSIPLTVGGGIRTVDDAAVLLDHGADKVSINTAAVIDPDLLARAADRFGCQCVVLALDAAADAALPSGFGVLIRSGKEKANLDAVAWAQRAEALGAGEILLTSFDRDGTRAGYDLALTRAISSAVALPVIASGGAAGPHHLLEALNAGADAVLAASIFHDQQYTIAAVKAFLAANQIKVRT